jgi:hypothetical protein
MSRNEADAVSWACRCTTYLVKKVFPHWYEWKEAGVRGIPSPFIKIYERGRDTPHPSLQSSSAAA